MYVYISGVLSTHSRHLSLNAECTYYMYVRARSNNYGAQFYVTCPSISFYKKTINTRDILMSYLLLSLRHSIRYHGKHYESCYWYSWYRWYHCPCHPGSHSAAALKCSARNCWYNCCQYYRHHYRRRRRRRRCHHGQKHRHIPPIGEYRSCRHRCHRR